MKMKISVPQTAGTNVCSDPGRKDKKIHLD